MSSVSVDIKDDRAVTHADEYGICHYFLIGLSYLLSIIFFPVALCTNIKIVQEYERAVIFRLGRLLPGGARGPGLFFILPCIDTYRQVDLRVILTMDSVTVEVDAVVYYRIRDATASITNVENVAVSTQLLAQTTLRNILGTKTLAQLLADREHISDLLEKCLLEATTSWGVCVERVEIKDVRIPKSLQRALAAEAEAQREAKAKVIAANGEFEASKALREAAVALSDNPAAIQLRYLQTLSTISAEHNSTVIFPFPIDLMSSFMSMMQRNHPEQKIESPPEYPHSSSSNYQAPLLNQPHQH
uniref:Band 7 domain-containing protein n=1 Tax=Panagrolaimus sp. ES5 TaxID=591445 RepID=A0AC34GVM9_9BILA